MNVMTRSLPSLESLHGSLSIRRPATRTNLSADSPARSILTDFSLSPALTVPANTPTRYAQEIMKASGVRLLLVVDGAGECNGVVNSRDLIGGRRITQAMQRFDIPRHEVTVGMVQTSCSNLHGLSLNQLDAMTIGDLIRALQTHGDQHLLIIEHDTAKGQRLRGLVSAADIGRALDIELPQLPEARTFAEICQVILGREL
ncbi:CBS domain-containing protein [Aidingimonas lacisalsi]|uniref:CBS domain-containing protein n=1 Tax=Aidingimonas lacisalsi TaxID=2604086 RepID=UPI0011D196C3|nr:CBS domain-containing protein [Aidingimonas lacisalsi]